MSDRIPVGARVRTTLDNGYQADGVIVRQFKNGGYGVREDKTGYCTRRGTDLTVLSEAGLPNAEAKQCSDPTPVASTAEPKTNTSTTQTSATNATTSEASPSTTVSKGGQHRTPSPADESANKEVEQRLPFAAPAATTTVPAKPAATSPVMAGSNILSAKFGTAKLTDDAPHLIVEARAGTGKTTTLIEGLKRIKGMPTPGFVPSPQQQAVFDSMELSKGKASSICFVAFNKSIAAELKSRVPAGCEASTMHGMGFKAVGRAIKLNNSNAVNENRVQNIICEIEGVSDPRELRRREPMLIQVVQKLVSLVKMNLTETDEASLDQLVSHYGIDFAKDEENPKEAAETRDQAYHLIPQVIERCKDIARDGYIDYDDMVWAPVSLNLPINRYDILLVDEAQDLNRCQQALAKKAGKRLILCGDPKQAIYGFAGADADSMPRMARELGSQGATRPITAVVHPNGTTDRGCITLPLTVTRRCGKAIVKEAQKLVPDFQAFDTNPEGKVAQGRMDSYSSDVKDGDMVLCRVNAPLVSECFKFLKKGRKANIQGREVGQGLINLINRLAKGGSVPDLVGRIDDWRSKETSTELAKRYPSDSRLIAIDDKTSCLHCFTEGCSTVQEVIRKVESVFTDDKSKPGILLSSIHKAKGLEASSVFILTPKGAEMPHPMAKSGWQVGQEMNIKYVAVTRAIHTLTFVS